MQRSVSDLSFAVVRSGVASRAVALRWTFEGVEVASVGYLSFETFKC